HGNRLSFWHLTATRLWGDGNRECVDSCRFFPVFVIAAPMLGAMMIVERQRLPFVTSLGGRHTSSCMQFPTASLWLKAIAILLAIGAAGAWAGIPKSAASLAPPAAPIANKMAIAFSQRDAVGNCIQDDV